MSNYGALNMRVYNQALGLVAGSEYQHVISAKGTAYLNRVGNGECTVKVHTSMGALVKGNIVVCYLNDTIAGGDVSVCGFTIEEIHRKTQRDGMSEVRLSGRDLLGELSGYLHFVDIGGEYGTTLANAEVQTDGEQALDVADIGATKTYIDNYQPPAGSLHVDVNDASSFTAGDSIILQQDDDSEGGHLATISNIAANAIAFTEDALAGQMSSYGEVYITEVWQGDSVKVALGDPTPDGTFHYSRVAKVPAAGINADPETCDIRIVDGLTAGPHRVTR